MAQQLTTGPSGFGLETLLSDHLDDVAGDLNAVESCDQTDDGGVRQMAGRRCEGRPVQLANLPERLHRTPAKTDQWADLYLAPNGLFHVIPTA